MRTICLLYFLLVCTGLPAVSRTRWKIAWTPEQDQIFLADIDYEADPPRLVNKRLIIDNSNVHVGDRKYEGIIEPQNFRPPEDKELIWSQYGHDDRGVFTAETFNSARYARYTFHLPAA